MTEPGNRIILRFYTHLNSIPAHLHIDLFRICVKGLGLVIFTLHRATKHGRDEGFEYRGVHKGGAGGPLTTLSFQGPPPPCESAPCWK